MLERNNVKIMKRRSYIMNGFGQMIEKLKKDPKKIVFTEGTDERSLEAASVFWQQTSFIQCVLLIKKKI